MDEEFEELEFDEREERKEKDIYYKEGINKLIEADEISDIEAAFMVGYDEAEE